MAPATRPTLPLLSFATSATFANISPSACSSPAPAVTRTVLLVVASSSACSVTTFRPSGNSVEVSLLSVKASANVVKKSPNAPSGLLLAFTALVAVSSAAATTVPFPSGSSSVEVS